MADNSNPESYQPLIQRLEEAADGAHTYGAAIGLVHNSEPNIRMDLDAIIGKPAGPGGVPPAVPGLKDLWNRAQDNKVAKSLALRNTCSAARVFCRHCIHTLMPVLGESWNSRWNAAGFTGGSLAVPTNPLTMLQQLSAYFYANPGHETPSLQGIACTAVACDAAAKSITDADFASNKSNTDSGTAYTNFQAGLQAGRNRLTGLRTELEELIEDDDTRWYSFGFDRPADPNTPEVPANLIVVAGATGSKTVIASWNPSRRSDSFRISAVLKSDGSEVTNFIIQDTQASLTLDTLAVGTLVVLTVTARNNTGESGPSNAVEIAVP